MVSGNVAAGATRQTFNVTTQAAAANAAVNVSAAYAGATRTAALTVTPAAAPSNLTASAGSVGRIELERADDSDHENGFRIGRRPGTTCASFTLLTTVGPNAITYRNSNLPAGTYYRYRVRASDPRRLLRLLQHSQLEDEVTA